MLTTQATESSRLQIERDREARLKEASGTETSKANAETSKAHAATRKIEAETARITETAGAEKKNIQAKSRRIDTETQRLDLENRVRLFEVRKTMRDENIPENEINAVLPLP